MPPSRTTSPPVPTTYSLDTLAGGIYRNPVGLVAGLPGTDSENYLWFTEWSGGGGIGRFDPSTGTFVDYTVPTASSNPAGICAASDGRIWFTEYAGNNVASITP